MQRASRKKHKSQEQYIHIGFEIGLLFKGIDGLFEILGGILMLFLNPERLVRLAEFLTRHELAEDPDDLIANELLKLSHSFSISSQYFGVFYLASHGIIKCLLIYLLWRKKLWAYPLSIVFLLIFIGTQMYRFAFTHSVPLVLLTILDILMIVLTILEYRNIRRRMAAENGPKTETQPVVDKKTP